MHYTKEQEAKFKKLGIHTLCELALLVPYSYEDLRLHSRLVPHMPQLIDATIEAVYRAPNSLQITFFVHNFGHTLQGVIFRPKPYILHQFSVGQREYFYGMCECKVGVCSMSMPRKVTQVGAITAKYKAALRSDVMARLVGELLSQEGLITEGLPSDIAKELIALHFPQESCVEIKNSQNALNALKYTELHVFMRQLAKKRRYFPSMACSITDYMPWANTLPFALTKEQRDAIEDIQKDFAKDVAAKRMVVGDVGSGKTMVILAAAVMIYPHRSILMAPTTILANQLYEEACKYLPHAKVTLVTNRSKKIDLSTYDFIIGTHALLYREIPKSALVMVDEQHRFGTAQRNDLEKLVSASSTSRPHFLQFSATPIPRTQAMIETAHIDVSLITSTPFKKNIQSRVIHKSDFKELLEHIKAEIAQGHQILLVYPLVEQSEVLEYQSIDEARGYWEKSFSDVYVTHGKDKDKEGVLLEFREKGSILIATTVVEVGISLPRLSTVVIVGAERLGLSTLHQLRGRVSRTGLEGYCYLYTNQSKSERLDAFVKTPSGFDIANLDLKFRKSGDLLKGSNQSGGQFRWIDMGEDEAIVKSVKEDLKIGEK